MLLTTSPPARASGRQVCGQPLKPFDCRREPAAALRTLSAAALALRTPSAAALQICTTLSCCLQTALCLRAGVDQRPFLSHLWTPCGQRAVGHWHYFSSRY